MFASIFDFSFESFGFAIIVISAFICFSPRFAPFYRLLVTQINGANIFKIYRPYQEKVRLYRQAQQHLKWRLLAHEVPRRRRCEPLAKLLVDLFIQSTSGRPFSNSCTSKPLPTKSSFSGAFRAENFGKILFKVIFLAISSPKMCQTLAPMALIAELSSVYSPLLRAFLRSAVRESYQKRLDKFYLFSVDCIFAR